MEEIEQMQNFVRRTQKLDRIWLLKAKGLGD